MAGGTRALPSLELIQAPARQAATVAETAHRPWPLPMRPWLMGQTWLDLLFAHWAVPAEQLESLLPAPLELDRFDGEAYLGMTPFRLTALRARGTLPLPLVSSFPELNVRTYVSFEGKSGIWFLSLDASSRLAVAAARRAYELPYFQAAITARARGDRVDFTCVRAGAERPYVFEAHYRPDGPVWQAEPGTLEHFLVERYCLYALDEHGGLHRAEIHHAPWPLQLAKARIELNSMTPDGIELLGEARLLHFARRQDVVIWPLEAV